jgi:glycosyltransferase involved in cell wall biosynthesis
MDGMEWQRQKWGRLAKAFLKWTEKLAMKWSTAQVVDHFEVQKYFENKYGITPFCIPYGADIPNEGKPGLKLFPEDLKYQISPEEYFLVISRLEPENNLDLILKAYIKSGSNHPLILVGNTNTKYGQTLVKKFEQLDNIKFLGPIFNKKVLDKLRVNCRAYIHGHSVGGTNPSLSEAMAASCPIFAHDNIFNRGVLEDSAFYFSTASLLSEYLWDLRTLKSNVQERAEKNLQKVRTTYNWNIVVDEYISLFEQVQKDRKKV